MNDPITEALLAINKNVAQLVAAVANGEPKHRVVYSDLQKMKGEPGIQQHE